MTTETVQTYSIKIKFDESVKKMQEMQRKMQKFNDVQRRSTQQRVKQVKASQTLFADMLRKEERQAKQAAKAHKDLSDARIKGTMGGMTQGTGQKASKTAMAAMLRAEDKRLNQLERSKETLKNSAFWQKKQAGAAHDAARESIRERMEKVKTAKELKKIVAIAKADLELSQRKTREFKKQNFLMNKMQTSSKQFLGNWISFFAIAAGAGAITRIGQDFEAVRNTMKAVSADSRESGENFEFVKDKAFELGLGLKESAKGFAKMVAARGTMSLEDTKSLFTGVSEMGTLLGLSSVESGRSINAVMQIHTLSA